MIMSEEIKLEFVDKYCPTTLKDYVLDPDIKQYFKNMIKSKNLQNFTMLSSPGSGKTTLAKILAKEFDAEVLFVKCATEGGVDTLRTKVEPFCNAMTMDGRIKLVILDELDSASSSAGSGSSFQMGLRTLIEAAQSDTRFICTANFNKIIPAVLSRCPIIPLKFEKKDLLLHVKTILDAENVKYDRISLKAFIEESFRFYPDVRRIVKYLQFCSNTGELIVKLNAIVNAERETFVSDIVKGAIESKNLLDVRTQYLRDKDKLGDLLEAGSLLFNYVADNNLINDDGILKLTDQLFYLNSVVDKEPVYFGMLTTIRKYGVQQ